MIQLSILGKELLVFLPEAVGEVAVLEHLQLQLLPI
jgi:hypothetical protein